jgi:hypothetical protein
MSTTSTTKTPSDYQISTILIKENAQLPDNQESTTWKVAKYASLGLIPLLYNLGKAIKDYSLLLYHSAFDIKKLSLQKPPGFAEGTDEQITCDKLINMQQLSTPSIVALKKKLPSSCVLLETISDDEISKSLSKNIVIIPLIIKGGWFTRGIYSRDHITTLIIDLDKKKIIYIDPKGKTLTDHKSDKVLSSIFPTNHYLTVESIYQSVISAIFGKKPKESWTLIQRTRQYQYDGYNCGVHFLYNAYQYGRNTLVPSQLTHSSEIANFRQEFIKIMRTHTSDNADEFLNDENYSSFI